MIYDSQIFLTKEVNKLKLDGKMIVAHYPPLYMGSFGCCVETVVFVSVTFIAVLMTPIAHLFNVADKCK